MYVNRIVTKKRKTNLYFPTLTFQIFYGSFQKIQNSVCLLNHKSQPKFSNVEALAKMTRKKSRLILFPSCHDFKSIRVLPDFPKKHKIQSSRIYLITRLLCFETRYSCAWANDRGLWERDWLVPSHNTKKGSKYTETNK